MNVVRTITVYNKFISTVGRTENLASTCETNKFYQHKCCSHPSVIIKYVINSKLILSKSCDFFLLKYFVRSIILLFYNFTHTSDKRLFTAPEHALLDGSHRLLFFFLYFVYLNNMPCLYSKYTLIFLSLPI